MPSIVWQDGIRAGDENLERYSPTKVNGILLEMLSTIHFLIKSPEVVGLMKVIETEIT